MLSSWMFIRGVVLYYVCFVEISWLIWCVGFLNELKFQLIIDRSVDRLVFFI